MGKDNDEGFGLGLTGCILMGQGVWFWFTGHWDYDLLFTLWCYTKGVYLSSLLIVKKDFTVQVL
jgi:hypothetical protein